MNSGFIDLIVLTFTRALDAGFHILQPFSIGLFGTFAVLAWSINWLPMLVAGGPGLPVSLAHLVKTIMIFVIYMLFLQNLFAISNGVFTFFANFGASVGGFSANDVTHPSTIVDMAFIAATPIRDFILSFTGWAILKNAHMIVLYGFIFLIIMASFLWVIKDTVMTVIEFHFAMMAAPILIPWGIINLTQELAGFAISWILGVSVRMFLISAVLGIAVPLFQTVAPGVTVGGDPSTYSGIVLAFASLLFAVIASQVPRRAELVAGRGMALGLPGAALVPPGIGGGARTAVRAIRSIGRNQAHAG